MQLAFSVHVQGLSGQPAVGAAAACSGAHVDAAVPDDFGERSDSVVVYVLHQYRQGMPSDSQFALNVFLNAFVDGACYPQGQHHRLHCNITSPTVGVQLVQQLCMLLFSLSNLVLRLFITAVVDLYEDVLVPFRPFLSCIQDKAWPVLSRKLSPVFLTHCRWEDPGWHSAWGGLNSLLLLGFSADVHPCLCPQ